MHPTRQHVQATDGRHCRLRFPGFIPPHARGHAPGLPPRPWQLGSAAPTRPRGAPSSMSCLCRGRRLVGAGHRVLGLAGPAPAVCSTDQRPAGHPAASHRSPRPRGRRACHRSPGAGCAVLRGEARLRRRSRGLRTRGQGAARRLGPVPARGGVQSKGGPPCVFSPCRSPRKAHIETQQPCPVASPPNPTLPIQTNPPFFTHMNNRPYGRRCKSSWLGCLYCWPRNRSCQPPSTPTTSCPRAWHTTSRWWVQAGA